MHVAGFKLYEKYYVLMYIFILQAVDEPSFSKAYANMCKVCSKKEVLKVVDGIEVKANFRKILITRCQTEFERNKPELLDFGKHSEDIKNCTDPVSVLNFKFPSYCYCYLTIILTIKIKKE